MTEIKEKQPLRITFFGDSIFVGQGVSIYRGWVTKIAQYMDEFGEKIAQKILVTNASVNGRTTRQALEDMPYTVQSQGVDILVVQFGLNDCNYWQTDKGLPRVSVGAYKENLREILMRGVKFGARRILLNNNHPTSRNIKLLPNSSLTYEQSNIQYCEVVRKLAEELGENILFQDVYKYFTIRLNNEQNMIGKYLLDDGLHLSEAGHQLYFDLMQPILTNVVSELLADDSNSRC